MSASKLEKNVVNLERRLREEFRLELERALRPCLERLDVLEAGNHLSDQKVVQLELDHNPPQVELTDRRTLTSPVKKLLGDVVAPKPDEEDDDLGVERNLQTSQPADDAMEPVAFLETTWNLVLVLGHASVGWVDVIIAWLLLVASAGIQITFSWILTSESFLGEPFDERQVETALSWRRSVAHDHTYLDLAHTSLTSRVCNNDGSLIISTEQAALIQRINSFLNLEVHELEATDFRLGILLAMLCILLWCLYLCNEFRTIFLSLEAVAQIPRRPKTTFQNGRFETISFARFWAYCLLRILRACIAGTLLYAGILWLGSTTSITDLILNAVALGAILEVDAMVFSALMPKKLQLKVQDLEAIKVQYSRCRSQTESLCILVILAALLAWPWFVLVQPLGQTMEAVKQAHCGGHQDFVIGLNKDQNMPVGFQSIPFNRSADKTLTQLAVDDYLFKEDIQATYITFHSDIGRFQKYQTQTMKEAASEHTWCADLDIFFQAGSEFVDPRHAETASYYRPHFMSAILGLGFPSNSSCADMQEKCDDPNGQCLRHVLEDAYALIKHFRPLAPLQIAQMGLQLAGVLPSIRLTALISLTALSSASQCPQSFNAIFADMHDGDQKEVTVDGAALEIKPHGNNQTWRVTAALAESCTALIDFNVPGKPNPPPVKLLMTLWWAAANSEKGALEKVTFEFSDPSSRRGET
ncbi:Uncharacterized protein SCF082_LOCUS18241 [Durusdinium trenchii]|uniref:Uncharacterized protein n=1 Tax=Durusdinium trenchii TaxID=1381693 RepID=A0ABP0KNZ3_9DINO